MHYLRLLSALYVLLSNIPRPIPYKLHTSIASSDTLQFIEIIKTSTINLNTYTTMSWNFNIPSFLTFNLNTQHQLVDGLVPGWTRTLGISDVRQPTHASQQKYMSGYPGGGSSGTGALTGPNIYTQAEFPGCLEDIVWVGKEEGRKGSFVLVLRTDTVNISVS